MSYLDKNVYEKGTEVLIFKFVSGWKEQDMGHFIKGKIIGSEISDNISYSQKPLYVINYKVLGEDGHTYLGNMEGHVLGDCFFMTREMYIEFLNKCIVSNEEKINDLVDKNNRIKNIIESMKLGEFDSSQVYSKTI